MKGYEVVVDGDISLVTEIDGEVSLTSVIDGEAGAFIEIEPHPYPYYTGEYVVTPQTHEQILPTDGHIMLDDVTVKKVPYYETSNDYGITVYIASEVH